MILSDWCNIFEVGKFDAFQEKLAWSRTLSRPITTEELCRRWIELGAFYPFARNHSDKSSIRQELYIWDLVAASARKVLGLCYRLLPYFYTLMFQEHTKGTPIARPLFFSFPDHPNTYGINSQFLICKGVLISPVLAQVAVTTSVYFPTGNWFDLFDFSSSIGALKGRFAMLLTPVDRGNVHVKDGTVLAMQGEALTTDAARKTPFNLLVAVDGSGKSYGEVFKMEEGGNWSLVKFYSDKTGASISDLTSSTGTLLGLTTATCGKGCRLHIKRGTELTGNPIEVTSFSSNNNGEFAIVELANPTIPLDKEFKLEMKLAKPKK